MLRRAAPARPVARRPRPSATPNSLPKHRQALLNAAGTVYAREVQDADPGKLRQEMNVVDIMGPAQPGGQPQIAISRFKGVRQQNRR